MMGEEMDKVAFISTSIYKVCTWCQGISYSIHFFKVTMMEKYKNLVHGLFLYDPQAMSMFFA
jgi:hypothetical protein